MQALKKTGTGTFASFLKTYDSISIVISDVLRYTR
jgi:hypothetical protein